MFYDTQVRIVVEKKEGGGLHVFDGFIIKVNLRSIFNWLGNIFVNCLLN
jgi:hypothetical protein